MGQRDLEDDNVMDKDSQMAEGDYDKQEKGEPNEQQDDRDD